MRLFVAIDLPEPVRQAAAKIAGDVSARLRGARPRERDESIAWVRSEQLHLTIRFIGEVGESLGVDIQAALAEPVARERFTITLAGLGVFPPSGPPRVLWIGMADGLAPLAAVRADVERRLSRLGLVPEDRPYRGHLTIGRFRRPGGLAVREVLRDVSLLSAGSFPVERVTLYRSRLSSSGATHEALAHAPLVGVASALEPR